MADAPVRWGILSTARIGTGKVIPAIQRAAGCQVVALASRDIARARTAAARLGIPRAHGSYQELLADPEVDAVYVPLPNHLHHEWTLAAAMAGKHVLCEKPLAMDAVQAEEMVAVCAAEGVLLMEAFMYRLHPTWERVRSLVADGSIGDLVAMHTVFSYFNDDPTDIRNQADLGGGALMDIGCYPVNASRMIMGGEPTRVSATIRRDPVFGTDVVTSALLAFGGRPATFTVSTQAESDQEVQVIGTRGRIRVPIPFNIPADRPTRVLLVRGGDPPVDPAIEEIVFAPRDQYAVQAERFAAAVLGAEPLPTPPEDAVANMRVIDQVFAAAG